MSRRVKLSSISALTFYKDALTETRRNKPFQQLVCVGKPCRLYTPAAVRCESLGGSDNDIDWKCTADLPGKLRFGRVEVSCEGWDGPGDSFVLKEYHLVQIPDHLRETDSQFEHRSRPSWFQNVDWPATLFAVLWVGFLAVILYSFLKSCLSRERAPGPDRRPPNQGGGAGSRPGGWFFDDRSSYDTPPPYSKETTTPGWRPGFWSGLALGGFATNLQRNRQPNAANNQPSRRQPWDWEREQSNIYERRTSSDNRGEGSSNLGAMRSSTGLGSTNVR